MSVSKYVNQWVNQLISHYICQQVSHLVNKGTSKKSSSNLQIVWWVKLNQDKTCFELKKGGPKSKRKMKRKKNLVLLVYKKWFFKYWFKFPTRDNDLQCPHYSNNIEPQILEVKIKTAIFKLQSWSWFLRPTLLHLSCFNRVINETENVIIFRQVQRGKKFMAVLLLFSRV